jgi:hypothetical protein
MSSTEATFARTSGTKPCPLSARAITLFSLMTNAKLNGAASVAVAWMRW